MSETGSGFAPDGYFLKYIQAASAIRTITTTQRDELLISVFLAMDGILTRHRRYARAGIVDCFIAVPK